MIELASEPARAQLLARAQEDGLLPILIKSPGPAVRGRLALFIEAAIEETLERRGCAPPGVGAATDLDASLSDQLYRARLIGASGLALGFEPLEGIANLAGALDAEDSHVLRWWLAAARERPVRLYLDKSDRFLGVYGSPIALELLLRSAPPALTRAPNAAPELAASLEAMNLSSPTPALRGLGAPAPGDKLDEISAQPERGPHQEGESGPRPRARRDRESHASATSRAMAALFSDASDDVRTAFGHSVLDGPGAPALVETPAATERVAPAEDAANDADPTGAALAPAVPDADDRPDGAVVDEASEEVESPAETLGGDLRVELGAPPGADCPAPGLTAEERPEPGAPQPAAPDQDVGTAEREHDADLGPDVVESSGSTPPAPLDATARDEWRRWVRELDEARGPKPLSAIERMFVSSFVPLSDACALGIADASARAALESWSDSFAQSYGEAYDALRLRGKRPTMVLDVPDIAQRLARLHGARAVQLVLVDALRFDVGLRLHEHLRERLGQRAALTERLLLWSALPTTTTHQLELLARGPEALRDARAEAESTIPVARGRGAALLRRVRAGARELYKLDLVESKLGDAPLNVERLEALASEAAASIAAHLERAQERTLVVVFGDHGFRIDATGRAVQGGASPEEVLVPAFAWLHGEIH